jgi:hypothetical protein
MQNHRVVILSAAAVLVSLAVGFYLGVREGEHVSELVVAPLRGAFATTILTDLKEGKTERASLIFEAEVTRGLVALNELSESPADRFIASLLIIGPGSYDIDDSAVKLANYRKINPSPFRGEYLTHDPAETPEQRAFVDEAIENRRAVAEIVNRMVERYASK